jgi:CheY-like chemotaxis protein/HPt (histidine-containing phosphotransfer) domain-containing protein
VRLNDVRILLVDDGATNRKLISLILRRAGCKVTLAEDGLQAVRFAHEAEFDVILMDMQMPEMDGYSATRRLRDRGVTTPIVALTANAMKGDEEKCLAAGCSGYLTKPLDTAKLLHLLAELVGRPQAEFAKKDNEINTEPKPAAPPAKADGPLSCNLPLDDPIFLEIAAEFVDTLRRELWRLRIALTTGDLAEAALLAHWLKGSGGTAGFDAFTEPAGAMEKAAKEGDASRALDLLTKIDALAVRIQLPSHAK